MGRGGGSSEDLALMTEAAGAIRLVWPPLSCWGWFGWDGQAQNNGGGSSRCGWGERTKRAVYMIAELIYLLWLECLSCGGGYGVKGHLGLDDPHSRSPGSAEKEEHLPCTQLLLPPRAVLGTWLLQSRRNFPLGSVHLPGPHQPVFLCASIVRARQC